jgi:hypothetical protein
MSRITGSYITSTTLSEPVRAFVPHALPPKNPKLSPQVWIERHDAAQMALQRLSAVAGLVPSVDWLLYSAIRQEALMTSQIEGTQASLVDVFDEEAGLAISNTDDVQEVTNYLRAFQWVQDLDDASGIDGEWVGTANPLPVALNAVLDLVSTCYLPVAQAHLNAHMRDEARTSVSCGGLPYEGVTNSYTARCHLLLKDEFSKLSQADQADITDRLGGSSVASFLQFQPGERERLSPVVPV